MDYKKQERINIFEDTTKMINSDEFLLESVKLSKSKTKIYKTKPNILKEKKDNYCNIKVINSRSLSAINNFRKNQKTAVLNFASATNPGGGVKTGSAAQEESLCRCTTLYPVLNTKDLFLKYYFVNRDKHDTIYSDTVIYSPDIYIIKTDTEMPQRLDKKDWQKTDIITCAAPNLRELSIKQTELLDIHKERARYILSSAIDNNVENLVLGAFGCGAFRNNPEIVARAYKEILINEEYGKYFDEIIFAVFASSDKDINNFNVFSRIFKKYEVKYEKN